MTEDFVYWPDVCLRSHLRSSFLKKKKETQETVCIRFVVQFARTDTRIQGTKSQSVK